MAIFGPKRWVNLFGKMSIYTFWTFCLYSLESRFFVLEYRRRHFPGLFCIKKKVRKMAIFIPKPWVNPFGKTSIFFVFLNFFFLKPRKAFFVLEYRRRHFPGLYYLKEKVGKMAIFGPKPWVIPLGIMSIFRLFELLFFIS